MEPGQSCRRFYSDPNFFLVSWINEQNKLRQAAREEKKKRREERKAAEAKMEAQGQRTNLGAKKPKKIARVAYDPSK